MIVFEAVEQAHVQFVGGVIAEAYSGAGIGGDLAVPTLVAAVDEAFANGEEIGPDGTGHLRQTAADNVFIEGDYGVLETVGCVVFRGKKLPLGVGQKSLPVLEVQLVQQLVIAAFDGGK